MVEEDAAEVILIGEDIILSWEIGTTGVNEVHAWQMVLLCDFLRAQMLLDCDRIVRATLHGGIVRDDDAELIVDEADTCHHTACWHFFLAIELIPSELRELHERAARIKQFRNAVAHSELATFFEFRMRVLRTTFKHLIDDFLEFIVNRFRGSHVRLVELAVLVEFHAQRWERIERLRVRRVRRRRHRTAGRGTRQIVALRLLNGQRWG